MLHFRGVENCSVKKCKFLNAGGTGIRFDLYAQNNVVEGNLIYKTAYGGINISGYGAGTRDESKNNKIINNEIAYVNMNFWYGTAIMIWNSGFNTIEKNHIHHFASRAVILSAPRLRIFTKANQELFPKGITTREQAWPMIRWSEIPDVEPTVYYMSEEDEDGLEVESEEEEELDSALAAEEERIYLELMKDPGFALGIRRVEEDGYKLGPQNFIDSTCAKYRFNQGNEIKNNLISNGSEQLFGDALFYITATCLENPNKIIGNYICNTGNNKDRWFDALRMVYLDGFAGTFEVGNNFFINSSNSIGFYDLHPWWETITCYRDALSNHCFTIQENERFTGIMPEEGETYPRTLEEDITELSKHLQIIKENFGNDLPGINEISKVIGNNNI